jgi:hypothetical protein
MEPSKLHPGYNAALARPKGVTRLGAFYLVAGIITLGAIFSLSGGQDAGPIVSLLMATGFYVVLSISFLSLRRWAYWVALALHVAVALSAPLLLLAQLYSVALISLALNLAACYYLRRPNVRAAFSV